MIVPKRAARLLASLTALLLCASGARGEPTPNPAPKRIVSLAPSVTETLFALGVGDRVVAVSDFCDYPPEVKRLPHVGSFNAPSVEAVLGQRPDLVIGTPSPGNHESVDTMRRLGVRVEIVDPERLAEPPIVTPAIAGFSGVPADGRRPGAPIAPRI